MADHPHQYALERAAEEMAAADAKCRERIEQLAARSEDGRLSLNTREGFEAMMVGMRHLATAGTDGEANDLIARMAPWCPPPGLSPLAWQSLARRLGMSDDVARTAAGRMVIAKAIVDAGQVGTALSPAENSNPQVNADCPSPEIETARHSRENRPLVDGPVPPNEFLWKGRVAKFERSELRYFRFLAAIWQSYRLRQPTRLSDAAQFYAGDSSNTPTDKAIVSYAASLSNILADRCDFPDRLTCVNGFLVWESRQS